MTAVVSPAFDQRIADLALIASLRHSQPFTACAAALRQISNVSLTIVAASQWPPCKNPAGCPNSLCAAMIKSGGECASCAKSLSAPVGVVNTIKCLGDLHQSALPIQIKNRVLAFICIGPYSVGIRSTAPKARAESPALRKQLVAMPRFSVDGLKAVLELLKVVSDDLTRLANDHILPNSLPARIEAGRRFVEENYSKPIMLATVAKHAGMSREHFCRTFKKALGIGFSEFVNRTRIENAKMRLKDPGLRVTEISDQVGFKSLTHFNRTFKRIVGVNPTTYRRQAPLFADTGSGEAVTTSVR